LNIPVTPDELTTAWLSEKLGFAVREFEVQYFGEGAGIIGLVTRVTISPEDGSAIKSIIAKFPSPAAENREVAAQFNMYGREVSFYNEIAPQIDLRVPACHFAAHNTENQDFVILMEDLTEYRIGDQVEGCSEEDACLVIEGIAKFHANTWNYSKPNVVSHDNEMQVAGMVGGMAAGWPVVTETFADLIPKQADNLATRMGEAIPELLKQMCSTPVSIAHADVRLDNIFFGAKDIALVDWQSVCTSAPEQDLAYFVTQSLTDDVRNARDWVGMYHEALTRHGITYPESSCRARYRVCALYLSAYAVVIAGTLDLGNERGLALGRTLLGNCMRSLVELDAFSLLDDIVESRA